MTTASELYKKAVQQQSDQTGTDKIDDFAEWLDQTQRNLSQTTGIFFGSEVTKPLLVRDNLSSTVFGATTGWQIKGDGTATFRNVTVSGGSLLITNTTDRIHLQSDGDAFFGSDISAPATTSFSIFSNAQTYNSESMGAGDVLFGDNSSGKANLLWDVSSGQIKFRGGTTTQGYIDTTGAAVFGGGIVRLDTDGVQFVSETAGYANYIEWVDVAGETTALIGGYGAYDSGTTYLSMYTKSSLDPYTTIGAYNWAPGTLLGLTLGLRYNAFHLYSTVLGSAIDTAWLDMSASNTVFNEDGGNIDLRVEGDTATNLLICDAGLDAVQIGTTTAGVILDARSTGVIINDAGASTIDFTVEGDTETQLLFVDASADKVYYKGDEIGIAGAGGVSIWQVQMFS